MATEIRQATPADAPDIYRVHLSNGGSMPWDDVTACREHIEWMIELGNPPIVTELDGAVVGEMEIWWGQDVPELARSLDISMLEVHRDHHRHGVGSALVARAIELSKQRDCEGVSVWTDPKAIGFYRKHGFKRKLLLRTFSIDSRPFAPSVEHQLRAVRLAEFDVPDGRHLQTQRLLHPIQRWHNLAHAETNPPAWKDSDQRRAAIFACSDALSRGNEAAICVYRLSYWKGDPGSAELYLWCPTRERAVLVSCIGYAGEIGVGTVTIRAYGEIADWLSELGSESPDHNHILYRRSLE